jgi:hypothetical protein
MKKILVLTCLLFFSAGYSNAQEEQKLHFGLKAAPALAWISSDTKGFESDGTKLGFSYGLITEFNFATHYAFATGIDVTYRGGKSKFQFNDSTVSEIKYNLEYIELPVSLKFKTNEIGYFTYYLQFGLEPGINIRGKADAKTTYQMNGVTSINSEDNLDIKDEVNNFNLSMIIGGGVEYTLSGSTVLLVGITFNNGFLDILDADNIKANSDYLALTVGILF